MLKYKVYALGCKVSQAEGVQLRELLHRYGHEESSPGEIPDLCLINACAVTSTAAGKSRRLVRRLSKLYPSSRIALLGCYASIVDPSIRNLPQLTLIADHGQGINSTVEHYLQRDSSSANHNSTDYIKTVLASKVKKKFNQSRHRAFLKVQDGCDAGCTYCIIGKFRSKIKSLTLTEAMEQAAKLVDAGHKEIVLCGIFLGAFGKKTCKRSRGKDNHDYLAELVGQMLKLPGLARLRLSSLEPMDLTEELLRVLANSEKIAAHLHLPLQSGSDNVLKKMGRQYLSSDYISAVNSARKALPDLAITTDIIVGFPFETDDDFDSTLKIARKSEFSKIHTFPFSPREGTPAWNWKSDIPNNNLVQRRLVTLRSLESELKDKFWKRFVGKNVRVLVEKAERKGKGYICSGRSDQYFAVQFEADKNLDNKICTVKINNAETEPLSGELREAEEN